MDNANAPIGIIDSGVGGISVLKELKKLMPRENYLYLSDTLNAPYGTKSESEILRLTEGAVKKLVFYPCKLIIIACNTATAVAADLLRERYRNVPIVGLEPAIAPAVRENKGGDILVLTTEATEKTDRFKRLIAAEAERAQIVSLPVQKLVRFVESGKSDREEVIRYLCKVFFPYKDRRFSAVVLGCTHFPFAKDEIEIALGYSTRFYDGSVGAAKRAFYLLSEDGNMSNTDVSGVTVWLEDGFSVKGRNILRI